jgi:hypothetical protein
MPTSSNVVSVCVPYWDRQPALDRMFEQYARLYPELPLEFSVCDDGSPIPAVVPDGVILTRLPEKPNPLNPCVPINAAVAASSGDIIVLTGPEIEHREPVLGALLAVLEDKSDYVTARCWDVDRSYWIAGPEVDYRKDGRLPVPQGGHYHFLAALHRDLWERAGGFDPAYRAGSGADDADWLWRVHRAGARFHLADVTVYHYRGNSWWSEPHNEELFYALWPETRE